jgi:Uma2 family endonuclease
MVETPYSRPTAYVDYPESDGQPMTESDATRNYLVYCVEALRLYFQGHPQVYVSGNLFIYYQEGDNTKSLSPDVFVVFGVSKRQRRSYKAWQEEGKLPAFVLEITSLSTKKQDEEIKPALYASLGVQEYFQYDPTGDYLQPQLKGRRLVEGRYEPIAPLVLADTTVCLHSQTLRLDLRLLPLAAGRAITVPGLKAVARELRLVDPVTDAMLLTYAEVEQARLDAEQVVTEERQRADQAEQQAEQADQRADQAEQQAEQERLRAEQEADRAAQAEQRLAEMLAELRSRGIDLPD